MTQDLSLKCHFLPSRAEKTDPWSLDLGNIPISSVFIIALLARKRGFVSFVNSGNLSDAGYSIDGVQTGYWGGCWLHHSLLSSPWNTSCHNAQGYQAMLSYFEEASYLVNHHSMLLLPLGWGGRKEWLFSLGHLRTLQNKVAMSSWTKSLFSLLIYLSTVAETC